MGRYPTIGEWLIRLNGALGLLRVLVVEVLTECVAFQEYDDVMGWGKKRYFAIEDVTFIERLGDSK